MPSTIATSARPWDSPAVVHRNTRPIFPWRGRPAKPPSNPSGDSALQQERVDVPVVFEAHLGQPSRRRRNRTSGAVRPKPCLRCRRSPRSPRGCPPPQASSRSRSSSCRTPLRRRRRDVHRVLDRRPISRSRLPRRAVRVPGDHAVPFVDQERQPCFDDRLESPPPLVTVGGTTSNVTTLLTTLWRVDLGDRARSRGRGSSRQHGYSMDGSHTIATAAAAATHIDGPVRHGGGPPPGRSRAPTRAVSSGAPERCQRPRCRHRTRPPARRLRAPTSRRRHPSRQAPPGGRRGRAAASATARRAARHSAAGQRRGAEHHHRAGQRQRVGQPTLTDVVDGERGQPGQHACARHRRPHGRRLTAASAAIIASFGAGRPVNCSTCANAWCSSICSPLINPPPAAATAAASGVGHGS